MSATSLARKRGIAIAIGMALLSVCVICCNAPSGALGAEILDLSGQWRFELDVNDVGVAEAWFSRRLSGRIQLPGSLQEQGFGNDPSLDTLWTGDIVDRSFFDSPRYRPYRAAENFKIPFWLQPRKYFVGPAWYQRDIAMSDERLVKRIVLRLERCHWQTTVWINDKQIGSRNSLSTPHEYDLTLALTLESKKRRTHMISIRVDNRVEAINVGPNSHSVTDHTQSNWNGVVGDIQLQFTDRVWIDDVQVYPDIAKKTARTKVTLGSLARTDGRGTLTLEAHVIGDDPSAKPPRREIPVSFRGGESTVIDVEYPLGKAMRLWDEFQPALYRLQIDLRASTQGARHHDATSVKFGMREVATQGTQFVLNGRPVFLRGTLECCIFPKTGYPPTDVASWQRIIGVCQAHGLNHIRFHSHCPPKAAFAAADQLGFYLQVECGAWPNQGASLGSGNPIDQWLYAEADRILTSYGNHPSFLLMASGNEPAGAGRGGRFLGPWVTRFRQQDPRRVYTSAAGWPMIEQNQYHNTPAPRVHQWGAGLRDRLNGKPPATTADYRDYVGQHKKPVVSHEIGQWCAYPNFEEISKYTGVLQAKSFEIFRDFLAANHMESQAHEFLMASGKLQTLCYKEEIESALRTPGLGGFQLLDLHDFPGQGTALVGVLDPFWDSKPYVTPEEFGRFCNSTVTLARLPKRVFVNGEMLEATIDVYHFGPRDFDDAEVVWKLVQADGSIVDSGSLPLDLPRGELSTAGVISVRLTTDAPQKLILVAALKDTDFENDWDVWVYPRAEEVAPPSDVLISDRLDERTIAGLDRGEKVLLTPPHQSVAGDVVIGFTPVFWNTAWTRNQSPHTLGILCDPGHPALTRFPTESHTNWQWWELINRSAPMVLNDLPSDLRPIVQVIDTWFEARRLGLVFEASVGKGRLLVCSVDIANDLGTRPVARQMRRSLLHYMASKDFVPRTEVKLDRIRGLFRQGESHR